MSVGRGPNPKGWANKRRTRYSLDFQKPQVRASVADKSDVDSPRVSIVILCYNKVELTQACLESLSATDPQIPFEVIVIDNASQDETPEFLAMLEGDVRVERMEENLGFVRGCNHGASLARGEFVLFLNNDTVLQPGWLEPLVAVMDEDPRCGAVSPMLIYPDGRVNDAGGLVFADGECWRYGMGDGAVDNPKLNSRRAVDYAMGACLLVRKSLWDLIGGFDERYAPAYYEDVDLSFAIRAQGYRVFYEPASRVVHVEGGTGGTDVTSGAKQYQVINRGKFAEKWADELSHRPRMDPTIVENWAHRGQGGFGPGEDSVSSWNQAIVAQQDSHNVLIIDPLVPMFDRNSGHMRLWHAITQLRAMGNSVTYWAYMPYELNTYQPHLAKIGVPVYGPDPRYMSGDELIPQAQPIFTPEFENWAQWQRFDTIIVNFWYMAEALMPLLRSAWPDATIVIDSVDVHFLREQREAELRNDPALVAKANETKRKELAAYKSADRLIACTPADADLLRTELPDQDVVVLTNAHDLLPMGPGFDVRRDLLFVGNFIHHANPDALLWWRDEVAPLLREALPDVVLHVIGNDPANVVPQLCGPNMVAHGWVQDLVPHLQQARISVAPLRFGAGMKGKVGEALSAGLPVVGSPIAVEGMDLVDGKDVLVAKTPEQFVEQIVTLYNNKTLWETLRENGRQLVDDRWGVKQMRGPLTEVLAPREVKTSAVSRPQANKRYTPPSRRS